MHFRLTRVTQSEEGGRYVPLWMLNLRKDFFQMESLLKSFSWELLLMSTCCAWGWYRSGGTCRAITADNTVFPWLCLVCACLFFSQMLLWKKGIFLKIEINLMVLNKVTENVEMIGLVVTMANRFPMHFVSRAMRYWESYSTGQSCIKKIGHGSFTNASGAKFEEHRLRTRPVEMSRGRFRGVSFNRSPSHYK